MSATASKKNNQSPKGKPNPQPNTPPEESISTSITFSKNTYDVLEEMKKLPQFRNNRSNVVETLIINNPQFKEFIANKKR